MCITWILVLLDVLLSSPDSAGPPGGDETDLPTGRGAPLDRRRLADMLMVAAAVGMLDGVHGHAADLGPAVALRLVLVVGAASLQHGLVDTAAAGNDSHHGAVGRGDDLQDIAV